jgi:hypothetical protein
MLRALSRAFDRFRGSGDAAVTIPSMDGAFRPNERLDTAPAVLDIEAPDNLASDGRRIFFSSGTTVYELKRGGAGAAAERLSQLDHAVACLDVSSDGAMAIGLVRGGLLLRGGVHDGKPLTALEGRPIACPTALRFVDSDTLIICIGSECNDPAEWKRDLLDGQASGSVWRVDLRNGRSTCLADGLAWPYGLVVTNDNRVVIAESWRHRLLELGGGRSAPLLSELPGYPARISSASAGGFWLTIFAPRSQLVEFVLREPRFRRRMMRDVDPEFWVAPSLHHMIDYREPLQAGAVKQLGELKPWAPSRSYGLVVRLDTNFNPIASFHSRANGKRHGLTSCLEIDGYLLATSKGGNIIVTIDVAQNKELIA